jgi:hypothetical protein
LFTNRNAPYCSYYLPDDELDACAPRHTRLKKERPSGRALLLYKRADQNDFCPMAGNEHLDGLRILIVEDEDGLAPAHLVEKCPLRFPMSRINLTHSRPPKRLASLCFHLSAGPADVAEIAGAERYQFVANANSSPPLD